MRMKGIVASSVFLCLFSVSVVFAKPGGYTAATDYVSKKVADGQWVDAKRAAEFARSLLVSAEVIDDTPQQIARESKASPIEEDFETAIVEKALGPAESAPTAPAAPVAAATYDYAPTAPAPAVAATYVNAPTSPALVPQIFPGAVRQAYFNQFYNHPYLTFPAHQQYQNLLYRLY